MESYQEISKEAKKEIQLKIANLKNSLPEALLIELFADVDEKAIENARLVTGKDSVFHVESCDYSSYYTFVFGSDGEISIDYIEINQLNSSISNKVKIDKRTRSVKKIEDRYILIKEYPERMIDEDKSISKEMYIKETTEYDINGNMINPEKRKFFVGGIIYKQETSIEEAIKREFTKSEYIELKEINIPILLEDKKPTRVM
jgi:hypothetical protein